jgi:hypothetical protein
MGKAWYEIILMSNGGKHLKQCCLKRVSLYSVVLKLYIYLTDNLHSIHKEDIKDINVSVITAGVQL